MKHRTGIRRMRGMTLMELIVVMTVVGILAAIAIPGYRGYVMRVTRTDAKRDLMSLAQRLERCFTRTNDYTRLDDIPTACVTLPQNTAEGTYTITGVITANTFVLTATPQGAQAADAACGRFIMDQLGRQMVSAGTGTTASNCWSGRRG